MALSTATLAFLYTQEPFLPALVQPTAKRLIARVRDTIPLPPQPRSANRFRKLSRGVVRSFRTILLPGWRLNSFLLPLERMSDFRVLSEGTWKAFYSPSLTFGQESEM